MFISTCGIEKKKYYLSLLWLLYGAFYAYATWRDSNVPVYKSTDMINWEYVGGDFEKGQVPMYVKGGAIWAPDIN